MLQCEVAMQIHRYTRFREAGRSGATQKTQFADDVSLRSSLRQPPARADRRPGAARPGLGATRNVTQWRKPDLLSTERTVGGVHGLPVKLR